MRKSLLVAFVAVCSLIGGSAVAIAGSNASENAHHMQWDSRSDVVHVLIYDDAGRPGQPPATIPGRSPLRLGFEWGLDPVDVLEAYVGNPDHDIQLAIDGGSWFSAKSGYQPAFVAVPGEGPRWSWDHDGDGLGDGNGNGIGDWDFPVLFWRYTVSHLDKGLHTVDLRITDDGGATFWITETITAIVG